ncbi:MAG: hypothetical protein EOP00_17100 [Pedobacter sp.]|nr:MAG: hypothetical protein EOP00_17100 [Pedobacter sp.]
MQYLNFNGKLIPAGTAIIDADNRGLRFGDGLFETIKYKNGELQLIDLHLDRLWQGLAALMFDIPRLFTKEYLTREIAKLIHKNRLTHARIRLLIIRGKGGLFDPENLHPVFVIQSWPLDDDFGKLNSNGLELCFYGDAIKSCDSFSHLKHNNFLPYLMGALFAKSNHCNDAIILNEHRRIADTTIANIFSIHEGAIYTPPLAEGCIAGTMRQFLLDHLPKKGFKIVETPLTKEFLLEADEVFLTNAMSPVKWVRAIGEKEFSRDTILDIHRSLSQTFPAIFC